MEKQRLDKLISDRAGLSRARARELIRAGRVRLEGVVAKSPDLRVEQVSGLTLDGEALEGGGYKYVMLNKPRGVLSATRDREQKTVLDLLPTELSRDLFPVGRLDKDVTGLIILTDDGDFCHRVASPKTRVVKTYQATVAAPLDAEDETAFAGGIVLRDGTVCRPAVLRADPDDPRRCRVELSQGMYHQVKRMFASRGKPVEELRRVAVGGLRLDESLPEGGWRLMTGEEAELVFKQEITN